MNLEKIISILVKVVSESGMDEDIIYESLISAGIESAQAIRFYQFTQIAWGRVFLDGMGITFSNDYFCFDSNGSVIESGNINDEDDYRNALSIANQYLKCQEFTQIALASSDVNSINEALNNGEKPENLTTSPSFIFLESPTEDGYNKVQEFIKTQIELLQSKMHHGH